MSSGDLIRSADLRRATSYLLPTSLKWYVVSTYGCSFGWLQPSFEYGGRSGPYNWFIIGDFLRNDRGIEKPTPSYNAPHDTTNQLHGLAYLSAIVDPDTRISLILGAFDGHFQIPNNPGQQTLGFAVNGISSFNSATLNETQRERNDFANLSLRRAILAGVTQHV